MRRILFTGFLVVMLTAQVWAGTPFQEYNPDIDKFAFAKSYIASLSYYGRIDKRLAQEEVVGDKFDKDISVIKTLIDNRTLDNAELRVAKNYLTKYAPSKNMLIRKVTYDTMLAYERHIAISTNERRLWEGYYRVRKLAMVGGLNEADFKKQMIILARDRKAAAMGILEAVLLFKKVLLSAAYCADQDCQELALTRKQRDKLLKNLDSFAGDNMAWGMKPGQGTFEAAIASVREVLEDSAYVPLP